MNLFFIEKYIQKIKKEDIFNYANNQGINLTKTELDTLYNYLKFNYKIFLYNKETRPNLLTKLKSQVTSITAKKIDELYYQYKDKI